MKIGISITQMPLPNHSRKIAEAPIKTVCDKARDYIAILDNPVIDNASKDYCYKYLTSLYKKLLCIPTETINKSLAETGQLLTEFLLSTSAYADSPHYIDIDGKDINHFKNVIESMTNE